MLLKNLLCARSISKHFMNISMFCVLSPRVYDDYPLFSRGAVWRRKSKWLAYGPRTDTKLRLNLIESAQSPCFVPPMLSPKDGKTSCTSRNLSSLSLIAYRTASPYGSFSLMPVSLPHWTLGCCLGGVTNFCLFWYGRGHIMDVYLVMRAHLGETEMHTTVNTTQ